MIVVISHPGDLHAQRVLERLSGWGHETFLFDVADLPARSTLTIDHAEPTRPRVRLGRVDITEPRSVWWRRPQFVQLDTIADADALGLCHGEWHAALECTYGLLRGPWMNRPVFDALASRKASQLVVASELGLRVPATLMTSEPDEARAFIERIGIGRTIYKIFSATSQVWRETRLVTAGDLDKLDALRLAPVIFQEYIPAVADLRVTVVGDAVFPMAIDSRGTSYEVDFRVSLGEASTGPATLPDDVEAALRSLMARLGLVYGAIDLRRTPEGEHVFLEINPAGEFLFAEHGTGFPITDAVAGWLAAPTGASADRPDLDLHLA